MSNNSLAEALGRVPSGIFIVTARKEGKSSAMLASWVQQASFDPPTLTLAVHRDRGISEFLDKGAEFGLHVLSEENDELYRKYVRGISPDSDPFDGVKLEASNERIPILSDAMAVLECKVRDRINVGDHDLLIADIQNGDLRESAKPRVHIRKNGLGY